MPTTPMTDAEKEVIEQLKQGDELTWEDFLDELDPPLYRRLLEFADGNVEKAYAYKYEILFLLIEAIKNVNIGSK